MKGAQLENNGSGRHAINKGAAQKTKKAQSKKPIWREYSA